MKEENNNYRLYIATATSIDKFVKVNKVKDAPEFKDMSLAITYLEDHADKIIIGLSATIKKIFKKYFPGKRFLNRYLTTSINLTATNAFYDYYNHRFINVQYYKKYKSEKIGIGINVFVDRPDLNNPGYLELFNRFHPGTELNID